MNTATLDYGDLAARLPALDQKHEAMFRQVHPELARHGKAVEVLCVWAQYAAVRYPEARNTDYFLVEPRRLVFNDA